MSSKNPIIIHFPEVVSTNTYLRNLLQEKKLQEGTTVWADYQTGGRGQMGNVWESESGKNITFSMLLHPIFVGVKEQFILSQCVALAVKDVLLEYVSDIKIKWPNDIYWKNRKICGILIENQL